MISVIRDLFRFSDEPTIALFVLILIYFWFVWGVKFICSRFYQPKESDFTAPISVIIATYHEDEKVLSKVISQVLQYPKQLVTEIIIVTDQREQLVAKTLQLKYIDEPRIQIISAPPGKRIAIDMGIRSANNEIMVLMDSDSFVDNQTITELIKPFVDNRVGGTVADQRIYESHKTLVNFFNTLAEAINYTLTIPAMSIFGQVNVLGGRCVAYRKKAVLPLLPDLVNEKFLGRRCLSGDDGRLTSLLLQAGWRTVYQSTAVVYTISPPTWCQLVCQRLRWRRNGCRRTIRAFLAWDGLNWKEKLWVWRKPAAFLQMISTWAGAFMMGILFYTILKSIVANTWFWLGKTPEGILIRIGIIILGLTLTRLMRIHHVVCYHPTWRWIWFPLFPWYLIFMWFVHLYAIVTMNKQGWITRQSNGAGGFQKEDKRNLNT